ncbi:ankyrin repeat-containing domain protein, partial [Clohesyomyces aquaticus]
MSNANQKPNTSPGHRHHISIDTYKDVTQTTVLGHRGPKIQTVVEVVKSEVGRSKRALKSNGLSKVQHAAQRNREAALLHYLRAGHSPDDVKGTGPSPLSIAVTAGYIRIVKILCEAGADCKASTKPESETPLHLAIKHGSLDIMDVLLSYGSDLDAQTSTTSETPLHYAASIGSLAGVVTLLKSGANYEATNRNGQSPAEVAFQGRHVHVAVAIISAARGNRKLTKEKEMLLKHVEKSQNRFSMNNELIADIFEAGCDPDSTVLIEAIKRNDLSLAEMFLDKGADPNRPTTAGIRPIFAALSCSSAQIVQLLVKHGADVTTRDTEGLTVLQAAFESPSVHEKDAIAGIFEALLVGGADPTVLYPNGRTLLHRAVESEYGLAKVALLLLQHGIHVNERDNGANTPLHLATHSKSCTELLLKNGAGPGLVNNDGLTPLLFAVTNNTSDAEPELESLVKVSNLRTLDPQQKSALHLAAQNGLEKAVRALLRCRANTTLIDSNNMTPLLLAAVHHRWSVVAILATQPGTNARDKDGMTALHHAAMSTPKAPAQWKDIAFAVRKFCERGISRTMRDRFGATPLIQAVKTLPEEGFTVIQVLLSDTGAGRSNCVAHEDHKKHSALYFAATLGKPTFVRALLMNGATFALEEWRLGKKAPIQPTSAENKQTLKLLAGHEWLRRMGLLKRHTGGDDPEVCALAEILPVSNLKDMLAMGLDPNNPPVPPRTGGRFTGPLLWIILNQTILQPTPPTEYLYAIFKLLLSSGADPNATHALEAKNSTPSLQGRKSQFLSFYHALSFLLEQHPTIDIDIITLFLSKGANLTIASSFYDGRYPLHSAVQGNRLDVVDEFLGRGADVNAVDHKQRTPLFIAAGKGFWELADILLKCGAKVDVKDADDNTPLHAACAGGSARIVNALLRKGAKPSVNNQKGRVPSECVPEGLPDQEKERIAAMLPKPEPR